jgi:predicted CopG family antitoxin
MATKTISIDLEAFETLRRARLSERDSFSSVIKRARWDQKRKTCADLLAVFHSLPRASEETLRYLEAAQQADLPPDDPSKKA